MQTDLEEKSLTVEEMLNQIKELMSEEENINKKKSEEVKVTSNQNDDNKVNNSDSEEDEIFELSENLIIEPEKDVLNKIDETVKNESSNQPSQEKIKEKIKNDDSKEKINFIETKTTISEKPIEEEDDDEGGKLTQEWASGEEIEENDEEEIEEEEVKAKPHNQKSDETPDKELKAQSLKNSPREDIFTDINKEQPDNPKKIQNNEKKSDLVSEDVAKSSAQVLKELIKKVEKPVSDGLAFRSGTTVEELVIEILKPELSKWLDKNLANIVRSVVEKEVRKLVPRDDE